MNTMSLAPPMRDPLAKRRATGLLLAIVVLWPMLVLSEFKPWLLFEPGNVKVMSGFVGGFFPPVHNGEFLRMVLHIASPERCSLL